MLLYIYEPSYRRLQAQIHAICPHVQPILMHADSRITLAGKTITAEEARPEAAWISTDVFFTPAKRDFLRLLLKGPGVKWLQSLAAGFEDPFFQTVGKKAENYTNSNGAAKSIAEFVFATVIDFFHPNAMRRKLQAAHEWKRLMFRDVAETNWLIIGYGNIGQETGKRAMAFEAHVTGVRRNPTGKEVASAMIRPDEVLAALPRMDVVALTADSNDSTKHLVNAEFLSAMKKGSVLVNIARGALIDETALLDSLDRGIPECGILDVVETEPLPPESPLWDHPRVRITAHCAAESPLTDPRGDAVFLRNLAHYVAGEPLELRVAFD